MNFIKSATWPGLRCLNEGAATKQIGEFHYAISQSCDYSAPPQIHKRSADRIPCFSTCQPGSSDEWQ